MPLDIAAAIPLHQRGSFQENSLRANIAELQATLLRQRVMVHESRLTLSIHLWDQALSLWSNTRLFARSPHVMRLAAPEIRRCRDNPR
jgi:hypothetical protein